MGSIAPRPFSSIQLFTLTNSQGVTVTLTNYGATVTSLLVPDQTGKVEDVVLGYDTVEGYINAVDRPYFGATIGRYGNRIARGRFHLDGQEYLLATNNGEHHLHGGVMGFDKIVWQAAAREQAVEFRYLARDGEEGYPGNLETSVSYSLNDANELRIAYHASTDRPTVVNLTHHSYFNLAGEGRGNILDHELQLMASHYTPVDADLIPTGEIAPVVGTPFDFTHAKPIGRDLGQDHPQLALGGGYDHHFVLDRQGSGLQLAAVVVEPKSGRRMEVLTEQPGVQFYSANGFNGSLVGKSGRPYLRQGAFCLETQHYPDSPNKPQFPSTVLRPGERYETATVYRFSG